MLLITHEDIEDDVEPKQRLACTIGAHIERTITEAFGPENCTGDYGTMQSEDEVDPEKFNL